MSQIPSWTSSAEAAERLGVKVQSLYAYVSRGQLTSHRRPGLPGTWFSRREVEDFARRNPPRNAPSKRPFAFRGVSTHVSTIDAGDLLYRGSDAVDLATRHTFEEVARWLLTGDFQPAPATLPSDLRADVRAVVAALSGNDHLARLQVAVAAAGARDPLRHDLGSSGLARSSSLIIGALLAALGEDDAGEPDAGAATTCLAALAISPPDDDLHHLIDMALVLLIDHGLATSTVAARVTASTRADPYAVVLGGLAALGGPLHGAASRQVHQLLTRIADGDDVNRALSDHLHLSGGVLVGFGSPKYPGGDPRAAALLDRARDLPGAAAAIQTLDRVQHVIGPDSLPTVDAALAVITLAGSLQPGTGGVLFAIARSVGWIAHAGEEYRELPLRWRGS